MKMENLNHDNHIKLTINCDTGQVFYSQRVREVFVCIEYFKMVDAMHAWSDKLHLVVVGPWLKVIIKVAFSNAPALTGMSKIGQGR